MGEREIIYDICSRYLGGKPAEISAGADWDRFASIARTEKVEGFLFHILKRDGFPNLIPSEIRSGLESVYLRNKAKNLLISDELEKTVRIFEEEKIPLLITKGAACLKLCYPDKGMRVMDDADIIVSPEDFDRARGILINNGYRADIYEKDCFFSPAGVLFDLHRDAFDIHRIASRGHYCRWDMKEVWGRSIPYGHESHFARYLSPSDQIIVSAIHAQKHSFSALIHFLDIALILRKYEISADDFMKRVDSFGGKRALYFAFYFLKKNLGVDFSWLDMDRLIETPLGRTEKKLLGAVIERKNISALGVLLPIFEIKGLKKKMSYLLENIFPRPEVMGEIFRVKNRFLILLFYPYRLIRLISLG